MSVQEVYIYKRRSTRLQRNVGIPNSSPMRQPANSYWPLPLSQIGEVYATSTMIQSAVEHDAYMRPREDPRID